MANVDELLSSLSSDITTYTGKDPLLPWLRGIKKLKDTLPSKTLKEKLPEFLQKCARTFELDKRYKNDLRYIRVWLHLMDFVDDPSALLRTMGVNHIGIKRCQFYQAYALYYEKNKMYDEAEKMYRLGAKNLAEPVDEMQKSYEQFLQRMKRKKKIQEMRGSDRHVKSKNDENKRFRGEHTVVVNKFVDTAMDGKSEAENACHNGLVDPTINMKEAMNAINSMFNEPLDVPLARKSHKNISKENRSTENNFEVFVDENLDNGIKPSGSSSHQQRTEAGKPHQESFQIYIDDEGRSEDSTSLASKVNGSVFPKPKDVPSEKSSDMNAQRSQNSKFREDTVVRRFVGSAILDEPKVENVCHNGLVDPTVNMKEAMNDINNMFGEPIDFVRRKRSAKQEKAPVNNRGKELCGFSILADDDDDLEPKQRPPLPKLPRKSKESDLFEPTLHTKEAMDDINKMFNMPLNF
ncbi:uncharacterized protein LOC131661966 [Vicia villosa]|uniref:uncharacterized protein LOC131661966 n=1 Tax=Vicia villosa TaxID=3911 RepID=UPI00273BB2DE|nr:uncharacterized protein LOC131661966 [Vicia villosa]